MCEGNRVRSEKYLGRIQWLKTTNKCVNLCSYSIQRSVQIILQKYQNTCQIGILTSTCASLALSTFWTSAHTLNLGTANWEGTCLSLSLPSLPSLSVQ